VLGTGAAIALSSNGEREVAVSTATGGSLTVPLSTATLTAPELSTGAGTTAAPPAFAPAPPRNPAAISWPSGRRGWTIVLLSVPRSGGRPAAAAKAAEARKGGLRRVGILDSSRFASLHPGYYVIFQGVYESEVDAASSLQRARAVFPAAYQRAIVP